MTNTTSIPNQGSLQSENHALVPRFTRRIACIDCHLIEPDPETWVEGRCPRCGPATPKSKRRSAPKGSTGARPGQGRKDLTGYEFGRLIVLGYAFTQNKKVFWKCQCACGRTKAVRTATLHNGTTRSCGCWKPEACRIAGRKSQAIQRRNALILGIPRVGAPRGEKHPEAKLTADAVRSIRRKYARGGISQRKLAAKYGVSATQVRAIVHCKSWRHLEGPVAPTHRFKLTAHAVRAMRSEYSRGGISYRSLAATYSISTAAVCQVITRKTWTHV